MTCDEYRREYPRYSTYPLGREVWDTPEFKAWTAHVDACSLCANWSQAQLVSARGHRVADYPCLHLAAEVTATCERHADRRDCPDALILYDPRFDEYTIPIRDGGSSGSVIAYCPWCGTKLPDSQRDRWFNDLEARGIDPWSDDVPVEYQSSAWRKRPPN